jgi:hypothetical protein
MNFNEILQNEMNSNNNDTNICHITFEKLNDDYIILDCKHTFNYDAIFNEVCIQKTVINKKETQKLSKYCIKCPYCRFVQKGILPFRENYKLIPTVNTPKCHAFKIKKFQCKYIFASGKNKGKPCNKHSEFEYCPGHQKIITRRKEKNTKQISKQNTKLNKKKKESKNEIISQQINIIDAIANSIHQQIISEQWQDTCEKKHKFHPIFNPKNKTFISGCSHVFKKGKFKSENCPKFVNTTSQNNSPVYYKNVYCKNHSKLKCNKDNIIIKPYFVPLCSNFSKNEINTYYDNFVNSTEYNFIENKGFYYKKECHLTKKTIMDEAKEKMKNLKIKKPNVILI